MNIILLLIIIICVAVQNVCNKEYDKRVGNGAFTFASAGAFFAVTVFIATSGGSFSYPPELTVYSIAFAVAYSVSIITAYFAISTGPLSLTSLIISYSLIIPAFYGIIFLHEPTEPPLIIGIILLLISLVFINLEDKKEEKKITLKWGILATLAFVGNGGCSVIQKIQQEKFGGLYKSEFMIVALAFTVVSLFATALFTERKQILPSLKKGFVWYSVRGLANGAVNFLVLVLALKMPASVMFPVISAGGIVVAALLSILFYKEKLSSKQMLGLLLGLGAIIFLNI